MLPPCGTTVGYSTDADRLFIGKDGKVEGLQTGRVGDDVDTDDLAVAEGEGEGAEELAARSNDEAGDSVDESRAGKDRAAGELDGLTGPGFGSMDIELHARWQGRGVGLRGKAGIEERDEGFYIAGAESGEEGFDEAALLDYSGSGGGLGGICRFGGCGISVDSAAGAAGELPRGCRSAAEDGCDLFKGNGEEVVEHEGDALDGSEAVEDDEEGQAD